MDGIYLDNNASTPLLPSLLKEIGELISIYGNPSSSHRPGHLALRAIEEARERVADFINARTNEILFTSGGTESINTVFSCIKSYQKIKTIVVSAVEHIATLENANNVRGEKVRIVTIGVDKYGALDMKSFEKCLKKNPNAFVSIMYVNNETGVVFPVKELCSVAKRYGALIHIDAVQAAGKIPINIKEIGCDFLSLSAHKCHGLKGCGVLFVKGKTPFRPVFYGHQESGRRGGTENVPGIVAMGYALREVNHSLARDIEKMTSLRDYFEGQIMENIPRAVIVGDKSNRICNTTNICFPDKDAASLVQILNSRGVYVSDGAACTSGGRPSHVLMAMGYTQEMASATLRFSLSKLSTQKEIEQAIPIIIESINNHKIKIYTAN